MKRPNSFRRVPDDRDQAGPCAPVEQSAGTGGYHPWSCGSPGRHTSAPVSRDARICTVLGLQPDLPPEVDR
jgi:hypothetical protein